VVGLLLAGACGAQNWEVGGGAGYGVYRNGSITSSAGTADVGVRNGLLLTGYVTEDLFDHFSGEVRYVYQSGNTFLSSGTTQGTVQAFSHAFTYDALINFNPRSSRVRPFVGGGFGAKYYETTGPTPIPQPAPRIAGITSQSQWKPLFDLAGGVRVRITDHFVVRGDLHDYITVFPNALFVPVANATTHGVFHQISPMFGVGVSF
jgi:hypothetical protein